MPDTTVLVVDLKAGLSVREKLDAIADRFDIRERIVNRSHALRWLRSDLDHLWKEAQAEEFRLERYDEVG
ncbi:MAG TPA: hypothetical protein VIX18_00465 [Nitrospirota bacterium]